MNVYVMRVHRTAITFLLALAALGPSPAQAQSDYSNHSQTAQHNIQMTVTKEHPFLLDEILRFFPFASACSVLSPAQYKVGDSCRQRTRNTLPGR